ncbi:hypothetical protein ABT093_19710 [Kitasatospora sp. NPDC002551]|uniref:GP88 family protein n=1 Tax=Kitasatospora sp. NPDC002551 TaxID=3154539 RepID=UPI00331E8272
MDTPLTIPGLAVDPPSRLVWPDKLLSKNNTDVCRTTGEPDDLQVFTWTIPAWVVKLTSGKFFNACPQAGICGGPLCYAVAPGSSYRRFPNVLAAHVRNLELVLDEPLEWERRMKAELRGRRYRSPNAWVRIHDAGDFFSDSYVLAWLRIARSAPHVRFYCYTKAISRFLQLVEPDRPANFLWCASLGGTEDHLVDREHMRHADVFPTIEALEAAGYSDQSASDRLAVLGDPRVGIPANRGTKLVGAASFGDLQRERDERRRAKNARARKRAALAAA